MNRQSVRSSRKRVTLALSTGLLFIGLSSWAGSTPAITLQQSVHFLSSDGSDVPVDAGTYEVDTLVGARLRLSAKGSAPLFLDARATTHGEEIEAPLAVTVSGDDPDLLHVVLLLPNGQALDAAGSISGARPRGTGFQMASSSQIQFAIVQAGTTAQPPAPSGGGSRLTEALTSVQLNQLQFAVQAKPHAFTIVSYGSKCLDFGPPPQVTGALVFLYDCNGTMAQQVVVQEINARHDVILRAGTKVIGVKGANSPPSVLSRGIDQTLLGQLQGQVFAVMTQQPTLELQDEQSRQSVLSSGAGQVFALDGDSIILASDRTRVVEVLNHRGANRTPLALGSRDLTDNEFWTFAATDKSPRKPTSGFVRVPQEKDLARAVNEGGPGTVIEMDPDLSIDLTAALPLSVPEGVTIRGDRRSTRLGPELRVAPGFKGTMFDIHSNDVRITGLRLRGPSRDSRKDQPGSSAIVAQDTAIRTIIDHNDLSDWTSAAVSVRTDDGSTSCRDHRDPRALPHNVRIARNFIHHNRMQNLGYGVVSSSAFPLIEGNTFYENRHAIAANGNALTKYRAWYNLVLSAAPLQDRTMWFDDYTHDFDVHGTGTLTFAGIKDISGGFGGIGGQYFEIAGNTFLGTQRGHQNFDLRGDPCYLVEVHHNVSLLSLGDAIGCTYCEGGKDKLKVSDTNQFNTNPNPTTRVSVGDFDGDGRDDLFLATGAAWYYAPAGVAEWRFLNAQTDGIGALLFGDFDGDRRTDVFTQRGRDWLVSWGGASPWEKINESNPALTEFRVGDFVGDKRADIFYADGQRWWVSDGGVGPFVNTQNSSTRTADLGFGDFNGDGKMDVVGVESGKWKVSLNATGPWDGFPLRSALTKTMAGLIIADFNGNGRADIAQSYGKSVSYDGRGNWTSLPARPGMFAAVGRFDENPGVDILFYSANGNYLGIQSSGNGAPVRHSRQDMR